MSDFPRSLPGDGSGFIKLLNKYGHRKGRILMQLHVRLGALLDAQPRRYRTNPVPIRPDDLKAIDDLRFGEGSTNQELILDQCRWALDNGLITESEFESTMAYMRMA